MAKPFEERASAAVANRDFRNSHLRDLIREGGELANQLRSEMDQANADSVNFQLSADDRDNAALLADQHRRRIATLTGAIDALNITFGERMAEANAEKAEAERAAALTERDELAKQWADLRPAVEALIELLGATQANERRLKGAGLGRQLNAEMVGRGIGTGFVGAAQLPRFMQMRIPKWNRPGYAWPSNRHERPAGGVYDPDRAERQRKEKMEAERAAWGKYRLSTTSERNIPFTERVPSPMRKRDQALNSDRGAVELHLEHPEAERLRGLGVKVEKIEDPDFDQNWIYF